MAEESPKLSYERDKARREMWDEIRRAEQIREDRSTYSMQILLSASVLMQCGDFSVTGAVEMAQELHDEAHAAAGRKFPGQKGPYGMEADFAVSQQTD